MASIKSINASIDILKAYDGLNPFLRRLKKEIVVNQKTTGLSDFAVDYILENYKKEPEAIGKTVELVQWYGEELQEKFELPFTPVKMRIYLLYGETDKFYHCSMKYRQSMEPMEIFLPKKAVMGTLEIEDYRNFTVDFDYLDSLSMQRDANRRLLPHQKDGIKFLLSKKRCILADDMGLGKMQDVETPTPTPHGFVRFGDLKVGDEVFGRDGKPHKILQVYPHKQKDIYEVEFTDGSKTNCGLEHLWMVQTTNNIQRKQGWQVKSLQEILDLGIEWKCSHAHRYTFRVPVTDAVEYSAKEYFIHPYLMGMLIGDGNLCSNKVCISIPNFEKESIERLSGLLNENYTFSIHETGTCPQYTIISRQRSRHNSYNREIKQLGLNVHGKDKFIPQEYLMGSIAQRKELLQGLMDSDGYITAKRNKISFSTVSKQLSEDVCLLVQSLGGLATIHGHNRGKEGTHTEYIVSMQVKFCPFKLQRKAERYTIDETHHKYMVKSIKDVRLIKKTDAMCIKVDSEDETYLTNNYIVTHNTTTLSASAVYGNFEKIIIICPASLKTNWKDELMWYVPENEISIIESLESKNKAELEKFLGYEEGTSGLKADELLSMAREKGEWQSNKFIIVNYDILDRYYEITKARSKEGLQKALDNSPLLKEIMDKKSLLIVDEAHRLSVSTSKRYKIIRDLIRKGKPEGVYLATGTPITNNPQNLYCILQLLNHPVTGDYEYYMNTFCGAMKIPAKGEKEKWTNAFLKFRHKNSRYELTPDEMQSLKQYIRTHARMITVAKDATNLDELKKKISDIYLRRTKEDLQKALPPKTIHEVYYNFTMEQLMEYNKLWDEYEAAQLNENPDKELNKDLLEGAIYRKYCSNQMVPNTIKLADEIITTGEKVIIFCAYDEELYALKNHYAERAVIYNGKISAKDKDKAIAEFKNNDNVMVFIGNIQAAGVGINLTNACKLIFSNFSFVPGDNSQSMDRCHRIGQTKPVDIYFQIFKGSQYEHMWKTVIRKQLSIDAVIKREEEK